MQPRILAFALALGTLPFAASAADDAACATVRMADPGWTDIASTNALLGTVLEPLGYEQDIKTLSVPIIYDSLKNNRIDAFLGSWQPAHKAMLEPLVSAGKVEQVTTNLSGVKFTLAVPSYVAADGVTKVEDLAAHADQFKSEIYGIEPGAAANENMHKMLDAGAYGLKGWTLVESSEQAMLSQVDRAERRKNWIVFLAWEPHPMNIHHDLTYLSGGVDYFGENYGSSEVRTLARTGFAKACPNLDKLLSQMTFTVPMENEIMAGILDEGESADEAARTWLKAHPDVLNAWLDGVETMQGEDGLPAVKSALGV